MSGTEVYYNRVLLRDCETLQYSVRYEQDQSNTDLVFARYFMTFASLVVSILPDVDELPPEDLNIHQSTIGLPGDVGFTEYDWTVADRCKRLQKLLEEPRKDFWLAINSTTFGDRPSSSVLDPDAPSDSEAAPSDDHSQHDPFRVVLAAAGLTNEQVEKWRSGENPSLGNILAFYPGKSTTIERIKVLDVNNGPHPSGLSVTQINGGRSMRVQVTIEVCRVLTEPLSGSDDPRPTRDAGKVKGVISNRWSIRETIDDEWRTSYSIEGVLRVTDRRYKPDAMRLMTSCYLIPRAKMTSREFYTTPDGLQLHYRYQMKEIGISAPPLTVDWDGTYTEKVSNQAITTSSVSVKLTGSVTPPAGMTDQQYKIYMQKVLRRLIDQRITLDARGPNVLPGTNPTEQFLIDLTIVESMKTPEVSASVTVQRHGDSLAGSGPAGNLMIRLENNFGKPLTFTDLGQYDPRWWPVPPAYTWDCAGVLQKYGFALGDSSNQYYQTPASEWHGKPRGIVDTQQVGERPYSEVIDTVYMTQISTPWQDNDPQPSQTETIWSNDQYSGYSYIHVEAENDHKRNEGVMVFPLSKPRPVFASSGVATGAFETVSVVPIHAGVQYRTYKAVCKRTGAWPKIPAPAPVINNLGQIETLVSQRVIPENPQIESDGKTKHYTIQCEFKYAINKVGTYLRVPLDPSVQRVTGSDLIAIADIIDPTRYT